MRCEGLISAEIEGNDYEKQPMSVDLEVEAKKRCSLCKIL